MNEIQLVVFDLASEHYGVDISTVREIMRMQTITKVPGAMSCVEGVINLRGKVLPVLDLRKRLELKVVNHTEESRIVVIDITDGEVGVIVDAVTEVLRVNNSAIEPPSKMVAHGDADYLRGIAKLSDRLIILLDLHKLLSIKAISDTLKRAADESNQPEEKEITRNGNGNKKKSPELAGKNGSKEYVAA
jgi:purine-binding chemotaxis protein CheW